MSVQFSDFALVIGQESVGIFLVIGYVSANFTSRVILMDKHLDMKVFFVDAIVLNSVPTTWNFGDFGELT